MKKVRTWMLLALAALAPAGLGGCIPANFWAFTPIPMPPWVTERMEEKLCYKNDFRTPILPPLTPGAPPPLCEDPPDESQVLRAWPHVVRGVPYFYEEFRDDVQIVSERIKDTIDPPRFFPLVGPAQLHHCHWKCTIYYTETIESNYPWPFRCKKPRVQVIYIDKDHLHLYTDGTPEARLSLHRDLAGY
jgi:hypothetical protein